MCVFVFVDDDDVIAVNAREKKRKPKKSKSKSSSKLGSNITPEFNTPESTSPAAGSPDSERAELQTKENLVFKESTSSSSSRLSLDVIAEDSSVPMFVALPSAVTSDVEIAIDTTAQLLSTISQPLPDREEEQFSVGTTRQTPPLTMAAQITRETTPPQEESSELRTAMLAVSKIKDDLAIRNK